VASSRAWGEPPHRLTENQGLVQDGRLLLDVGEERGPVDTGRKPRDAPGR